MDETNRAIRALLDEAAALLDRLNRLGADTAASPDVAVRAAVVARYVTALRDASTRCCPDAMLRACNVFTTVNKGLADAAWIDDAPGITDRARAVSHLGCQAGDLLRRAPGRS